MSREDSRSVPLLLVPCSGPERSNLRSVLLGPPPPSKRGGKSVGKYRLWNCQSRSHLVS